MLKKMITTFASIIVVMIGSVTVYAALGGKIAEKPIIDWLGIRFSDEYENYKVDVGQKITHDKTTIDLVSTVCDEGFTTLEFDVKLSEEDKKYLKIGEKVLTTEEDFETVKSRKEFLQQLHKSRKSNEIELTETDENVVNTIELRFNTHLHDYRK